MPMCSTHFIQYDGTCPLCYKGQGGGGTFVGGILAPLTPPVPEDKAEALLKEALDIVTGARRKAYGNPEDNFACIANLWQDYLDSRMKRWKGDTRPGFGVALTNADVAVMMVLMKCARLAETPDHHDSTLDIAGYAACLARCQGASS
jgi:hypothetical protein